MNVSNLLGTRAWSHDNITALRNVDIKKIKYNREKLDECNVVSSDNYYRHTQKGNLFNEIIHGKEGGGHAGIIATARNGHLW